MKTAKENVNESLDSLELILDEKIQSITPTIEIRVKAIKLIATVAPLLGLLGTVIGMIETFQAITLFGTGDPNYGWWYISGIGYNNVRTYCCSTFVIYALLCRKLF